MIRTIQNRIYDGIIIGIAVRGQINKERIFRFRKGNGHYNAKKGDIYQDQYAYFVPPGSATANVGPARQQWIASVAKWQNDLTPEEKQEYRDRALKGLQMSGFNLFMSEAMKGLIEMYVDRGDPAAADYLVTGLTTDGTWRTLDLSGIIPACAVAVHLKTRLQAAPTGNRIRFRKKGNTNEISTLSFPNLAPNVIHRPEGICAVGGSREIEYNADNISWSVLSILVRGWWT